MDYFKEISSIFKYSEIIDFRMKKDQFSCTVTFSGKNYSTKSKIKLIQHLSSTGVSPFPQQMDAFVSVSPSGFWQVKCDAVGEKRFIHLISKDSFESIQTSHGDFYTDDYFGSISWSSDEKKIVYVATAPATETDDQYTYEPDRGEGFTGKGAPKIVILDLMTAKCTLLPLSFYGISQVSLIKFSHFSQKKEM